MSERKVLNKYYPPDFDPSKIPRMKLPKNRQYTVRLMAPFNMRCKTCGEYIYKGKKFNARKEDVENEDYLGIRIYRFYIKCTRCLQEISFKTDPRNTDYEIEAGAIRNFMALKLAEEQAVKEEEEAKEEEASNPMKLLENRTKQSKNEIELLESLEELKDLNKRQQVVDYDIMLMAYDNSLSEREREERLQQLDEEYIKSVKFQNPGKRKLVVEEEIIEETISEPNSKSLKTSDETTQTIPQATSSNSIEASVETIENSRDPLTSNVVVVNTWAKSENKIVKKKTLLGIVKKKSEISPPQQIGEKNLIDLDNREEKQTQQSDQPEKTAVTSGLSLLGSYSDSDSAASDKD